AKGVIEIVNSGRYQASIARLDATNRRIEWRAGDKRRPTLRLATELEITGGESDEVTIDGWLIAGGALRVTGELGHLRLRHCTLVPGLTLATDGTPTQPLAPSLIVESANTVVEIDHCITGALRVAAEARVIINDSIIDATDETRVAYAGLQGDTLTGTQPGGMLRVENSTIIGKVHATLLELASNTIFHAARGAGEPPDSMPPVYVVRRQEGCVRFSYLPAGARVPRRFQCVPANDQAGAAWPRLVFNSTHYGDPDYCQLSAHCAPEVRRGANDESEMGAFHGLHLPQREAHLRARLDEYLRFGLEAGIFYAS
ncbi:MAG: hypothetical protein M3R15_05540, partial [Acidobacteriota bacterium]|nr:hypothetical protein [Acidobacteriota bacterium]